MSLAPTRLAPLFTLVLACLAVPAQAQPVTALVGARLIDGSGAAPIENGVILVRDGRISELGAASEVAIPADATRVDLSGKTLMPGMVNAHGHAAEDTRGKLATYARYGVTTVLSLGGEDASHLPLRDARAEAGVFGARLLLAGPIPNPRSAAEAERAVDGLAELGADWVKIRVERNSVPREAYTALISRAHELGLPVAAHMYDLATTRGLLEAGVDMLAHSVRDTLIDNATLALMVEGQACLSPTLMREVSTYAYASRPDFFDDPVFLQAVERRELEALLAPDSQQRAAASLQRGQADLTMAQQNLKRAFDAGVRIAMGTDSGAFSGRFPGYFEHLELELMEAAGLPRMAVLQSATSVAADCIGRAAEVGSLKPGLRADFLVLEANPLDDLANTRRIHSVWMDGVQLEF